MFTIAIGFTKDYDRNTINKVAELGNGGRKTFSFRN